MRIAIIEDNSSVAKGISYRLRDRGHATDVIHDGLAADDFLRNDGNDVIILDVNLPRLDGISILRNLRVRNDQRPVLLLTANSDIEARVRGLDAGADDYLSKPFDMDELEARIRALLRRRGRTIQSRLSAGILSFDMNSRQIFVKNTLIELPRRELSVIEVLISSQDRLVSKNELHERVYGVGSEYEDSAIEVHISRLRKRIRPFGVDIRVQRGLGYRLTKNAAA